MPLQNRVTPEGEIVATAARGTMFGNRGGCFHRPDKTLLARPYASKQWICCVLDFKGRRRKLMSPGLYTELFFLDEATALAAGHRPCFECRRADALRFAELWNEQAGRSDRAAAPAMDARLQTERIDREHSKISFRMSLADVPDGAFVRLAGKPHLILDGTSRAWSLSGYGQPREVMPGLDVDVLTPRTTVAVLALGFRPGLHVSATAQSSAGRAE